MVDTHTHLYFPDYQGNIEEVIKRCIDAGVEHLILPNVDGESLEQVKKFHEKFPGITSMGMGLHPTEVDEKWEYWVDRFEKELENGDYKAVGEVGLDLYWDKKNIEWQKKAFERQLNIADRLKLPVIIHSRSALEETITSIQSSQPKVPLIFHSFTGNKEDVKKIREVCDPYFGINGVVTYKNAEELREALSEIGLNRMLLETDSPFLTPVPYRGKRNESSYLGFIRDKIADTIGISPQEVEETTDRNAHAIFAI